jgi:hypothetical protein
VIASDDYRRCLDEETIARCTATGHDGDPRTTLADCACCGRPFWRRPRRAGQAGLPLRAYCSTACRQLAYWRRGAYRRRCAAVA